MKGRKINSVSVFRFLVPNVLMIALSTCTSTIFAQITGPDTGAAILDLDGNETGLVLPPEQLEAGKKNQDSLTHRGFVEMLDESRRVDLVISRMEELRAVAVRKGRPDDPDLLGFIEFTPDQYLNFRRSGNAPVTLDQKYLLPESRSFMIRESPTITQLHSSTQFGNVLIEEYPDTESSYTRPNIMVAGQPGILAHIKYQGNSWASALYIQYGSSFFIIETDRKIEPDMQPEFLEMIDDLLRQSK